MSIARTGMKAEHVHFLRELWRWGGVASSRDLGPQTSQRENSARQTCKRRGWVTYEGGYWRLTDFGFRALSPLNTSTSPSEQTMGAE